MLDSSWRRGKILTDHHVNQFYQKLLKKLGGSEAVCYRYFDETYSYRELYSVMRKLNTVLSGFRNKQVVLYAGKKFSSYPAIFSIILSKNIWLPLSPENPHLQNIETLDQANPFLESFRERASILYDSKRSYDHGNHPGKQ